MTDRIKPLAVMASFFVLLVLVMWWAPGSPYFLFVILATLFFYAYYFGRSLFPSAHPLLASLFGLVTLLASQSILQTIWYYSGRSLNHQSDLLSLVVTILLLQLILMISPRSPSNTETQELLPPTVNKPAIGWIVACLIPALIAFSFVLFQAWAIGTTEAIRTPWPLLPHGTLAALALIGLTVWLSAWRARSATFTAILAGLTLLSITLMTPLIYKLGFGFDGFLHRASEQILSSTGTLNPHPPYYIGQYVFVTWLARLFSTSIRWFDILLVPLLTSLLPFGILLAFQNKRQAAWACAALTLLLPLSAFIATTPQSFAYLLGLLAILLALAYGEGNAHPFTALFLGGWSLMTHPLAGLPFFLIVIALVWLIRLQERGRSFARSPIGWLLILLTIGTVPLAFFFNSLNGGANVAWHVSQLGQLQTYQNIFSVFIPPITHVALWADWAAFVFYLFPFVLIILAIMACVRDGERRATWFLLTLLGGGLLLSGFLLQSTGNFTFLIDYERGNYADRLFLLANLCFLLPAIQGISLKAKNLFHQTPSLITAWFILLFGWQAAQSYLALPRHDATIVGHGWSVGLADFKAVDWIEKDAAGQTYTVLANQSTSAAAVEEFGFQRYTDKNIFYYPIPTGGPLYQSYLDVTNNPSRKIIQQAATLGKSELVYVVLNDYWWNADLIAEQLSALADKTQDIQNGKARVYRFAVTKTTNR